MVECVVTSTERSGASDPMTPPGRSFEDFVLGVEPRLRRALTAAYGPDRGRDATAAALAWAWEHRDRLPQLASPVAYLYRVGQSRARRRRFGVPRRRLEWHEPWVEPKLASALTELSEHQRITVVLVHGYEWTLGEVADLLGVTVPTVQKHLERALSRLRSRLEVSE